MICFEPTNPGSLRDDKRALDISERFRIPVVIRLVTRLAHSRAVVRLGEQRPENRLEKTANTSGWMLLPSMARKNWEDLLQRHSGFSSYSEASDFNSLAAQCETAEYGVITTGIGRNYFFENFADLPGKPMHLHIGVYPAPYGKIRELASKVKRLILIEEGYPFIEEELKGFCGDIEIDGSSASPLTGN